MGLRLWNPYGFGRDYAYRNSYRFDGPFGASPVASNFSRCPVCGSRFPAIRCAFRGPPPRSEFKEVLRVVSPTRIPELGGRVKFDNRFPIGYRHWTSSANPRVGLPPSPVKPPSGGFVVSHHDKLSTAFIRSPIHRMTGTAMLLPSAL